MSEPVYIWRVVYKARFRPDAEREIVKLREKHHERNYKIVVLDGSPDYRIVYLRVVE